MSPSHRSLGPTLTAFVCVALLLWAPVAAHADEALAEAHALLDGGRIDAALALLEPLERERAGDPDYDALLGAVLLRDGRAARASIALERATIADPALAEARLDLAIAYYRMGAREDARQTLLALRALAPPAAATEVIDEYLVRLDQPPAQRALRFDLALGGGYDSNANSATSLQEFLGFTLTETSRAADSEFYVLSAGAGVRQPLRRGLALDAQLNARSYRYPQAEFVNGLGGEAVLGLRRDTVYDTRAVSAIAYRLDADGDLNSRGAGIGGQYWRALHDRLGVGAFARAVAIRYGDQLEVKDVDALIGGVEVTHAWGPAARGGVRADVQLGRERPRDDASPYGRAMYAVDADVNWRFSPTVLGGLGFSWLQSDYDDPFFGTLLAAPRADTLKLVRAELQWDWSPTWLLDADLSLARNDTNVGVYEYERVAVQLTALRRWR